MIRLLPDEQVVLVAVLGVDGSALRRGSVYGTELIDMDDIAISVLTRLE